MLYKICSYDINLRIPPKHGNKLRRVTRPLTELPGSYIGSFCFWSCPTFCHGERLPQVNAQCEFLLVPLMARGQGHKSFEPLGEMRHGFCVRRPFLRALP